MDCSVVRLDFPEIKHRDVVYLDSAASSLKPWSVIEAMKFFMEHSYANVHRGVYAISMEASRAYEEAHEIVARFINARSWDEVIFVKNTTEAVQLLALTLAFNKVVGRGDEVIVTEADHHSNIIPWVRVARMIGAKVKLLPVNDKGIPRWELLEEMVSERTRIISFSHASNVTGYVNDVRRVARIAHSVGALVALDGAQSVPHMRVDVRELEVDFIAFSGHKMLGPTGIGVLWGRRDVMEDLEPPLGGGGTVKRVRLGEGDVSIEWDELPWRFEAGTPPIVEAVGLAEAVRYLERLGMENVKYHERKLTAYTLKRLEELGDEIRVLGPRDASVKLGIVAFNVGEVDPSMVGLWLDQHGIAVRTGLHCAHILHDRLGAPNGSVRASFYIYNCIEDIDRMVDSVEELLKTIRSR